MSRNATLPTTLPAAMLLTLLLSACGGGDTPTPPAKTVNDLQLSVQQLSLPMTTFDAGNYGVQTVLVGNNIYFANYSNTAKAQYFARYNLTSKTFSGALSVSSNVCACGYMSKLVSDGTNAFYIANDATKYTASSNAWSALTYPTTAKDNAGEAGVTYANGNLYFVGGRTPSNLFKYYSIAEDKWYTATNYLYATNKSEMVNFKGKIYVFGGTNIPRKVAYYTPSSTSWTAVSDMTFDLNTSYSNGYAAALGDYIYILQGTDMQVYDPQNDTWATTPIPMTGLAGSYSNLFSDGIKLYIAGKNSSNIPQVYELTPSFK